MNTPTTTDKFTDLQRALTALVAAGVHVQFAEIYQGGQKMTAIILSNVVITEKGRLEMEAPCQ